MPRTKFHWTHQHIGNELGDTQRLLIQLADQMRLKHQVSEPDDITTDLCISVQDEDLTPFLDALHLGGYAIEQDPVCDNDVQKLAIRQYIGRSTIVDPTPLDEWEMGELELLLHRRRQSFLRILDEWGFEESDVIVPEGKGCGIEGRVPRYLAILDGDYSEVGGFREVRGYEYFTHAGQRYYEIVSEHGDDGEWHLYDCDRAEGEEEIEYRVDMTVP